MVAQMYSRQFTQYILGLVFLVSSSFALSNTEFTYNVIDGGIEVTGCVDECPRDLVIPEEIDGNIVISIGDRAFFNSSPPLNSVIIPHTIKKIKDHAFLANYLSEITLPDGLISIGNSAFEHNGLSNVVIPNSVTEIGGHAFSNNQIINLVISNNLARINYKTFQGNQLTSVEIPESVVYIDDYAFDNNSGLTSDIWRFLLLSGDAVITGCIDYCPTELVIPDTLDGFEVKIIGTRAFEGQGLTSVHIPDSVTTIWQAAFYGNQFTEIIIPNGVEVIGWKSFEHNPQLKSVTIGSNVNSILQTAFYSSQLTNISFLGNRPEIEWSAIRFDESVNFTICPNTQGWIGYRLNDIAPTLDETCDSDFDGIINSEDAFPFSTAETTDTDIDGGNNTDNDDSNGQSSYTYATFDIDQSGSVDALSDGLILLRYFFGLRGDALINNVISPDANRTSAADIEAYIESHMP